MAGCEDGRVTRDLHSVWQSRMNTLLGRELINIMVFQAALLPE
jgi:hypothetical protein